MNSSPSTLDTAMQCRMPKKIKVSGKTNHVTSVIAAAETAMMPKRRRWR
jgi:hypothetical protein